MLPTFSRAIAMKAWEYWIKDAHRFFPEQSRHEGLNIGAEEFFVFQRAAQNDGAVQSFGFVFNVGFRAAVFR